MNLRHLLPFLLSATIWSALAHAAETQPTVIDSEQLDMRSTDTLTTFIFTKTSRSAAPTSSSPAIS